MLTAEKNRLITETDPGHAVWRADAPLLAAGGAGGKKLHGAATREEASPPRRRPRALPRPVRTLRAAGSALRASRCRSELSGLMWS